MNSVLVVPVQLDALVLEDDRLMVEAMAVFSVCLMSIGV